MQNYVTFQFLFNLQINENCAAMGPKYEQKHTFLPSVTSRTFSCSSAVCRDCWSGDRMADKLSTRACFKERFLSSTAAMLNWTKFCSVAHARNLARNLLKNICDMDRWQESFSEMIAKKKKKKKNHQNSFLDILVNLNLLTYRMGRLKFLPMKKYGT